MKSFVLFIIIFVCVLCLGFGMEAAFAQEKKGKKVQEVSFDGSDIDGESRKPDGSYLVQKRGIDFMPLYNVRKQFDENIKDSVEYLK